MAEINEVITSYELVEKSVIAIKEEVLRYVWDSGSRYVNVTVIKLSKDDSILAEDSYVIVDDFYDLLISDSPEFAPGKPADEFRNDDLLYIVRLIKEQKNTK